MNDEKATPPVSPPAPERKFPWVRALLGLALVAAAAAFLLNRLAPDQLAISGHVEPPDPAAGTAARLLLKLRPGPNAPEGAKLCSGARVVVTGPGEIAFERASDYFLRPDEELAMEFRVSPLAAPGPRQLRILVKAELDTGRARRTVRLERGFTVTVGFPITEEKEKAKGRAGEGR